MAYRLTISDIIDVPVKGSALDGAKRVPFAFTLRAKRMQQEPLREALNDSSKLTREMLTEQLVGWHGQTLVADEEGRPADFNAESLACLLSLAGMESLILAAYLRTVVASDSTAERAKN